MSKRPQIFDCPSCKTGSLFRIEDRLVCDSCGAKSIQIAPDDCFAADSPITICTYPAVPRRVGLLFPEIQPTIGRRSK
jgi:uncharacterized protein (DUF983 family)